MTTVVPVRPAGVGAVLADGRDEWHTGARRYLSEGPMAKLYPSAMSTSSPSSKRRLTPRINLETPPRQRGTALG
jgi:hypothetical protein